MDKRNEAAWIAGLKAGDEQAFNDLIDAYYGPMLRLARSLCPSPSTAEEVAQETWLAVLSAIKRFEGRSTLKTWLFAILTNQVRKRAAKDRRFAAWLLGDTHEDEMFQGPDCSKSTMVMAPWPIDPEKKVLQDGLLEIVQKTIEALPTNQRAVVILRDVEDLDAAEVCELLKLSDGNQRVLLHRGRVSVRNAVDRHLNPAEEVAP